MTIGDGTAWLENEWNRTELNDTKRWRSIHVRLLVWIWHHGMWLLVVAMTVNYSYKCVSWWQLWLSRLRMQPGRWPPTSSWGMNCLIMLPMYVSITTKRHVAYSLPLPHVTRFLVRACTMVWWELHREGARRRSKRASDLRRGCRCSSCPLFKVYRGYGNVGLLLRARSAHPVIFWQPKYSGTLLGFVLDNTGNGKTKGERSQLYNKIKD